MHLINVDTLELKKFRPPDVPPYAILSHRWGADECEHEDFLDHTKRWGPGYEKIADFCREVKSYDWTFERTSHDGKTRMHVDEDVEWVWVDTCCIDKRNFTEYSEAINSMWRWYKDAAFCVVYLADVQQSRHQDVTLEALGRSEWFTRGWTLQELLASQNLFFYSKDWQQIGASADVEPMKTVARASNIPRKYLCNSKATLANVSVAKRMSWAANRTTTVPEDLAYCLLGVFDVNMALLYGEGSEKSFERLQKEILQRSDDESIFAFTPAEGQNGVLATSPRDFAGCGDIIKCTRQIRPAYYVTNRGLHFSSTAIDVSKDHSSGTSQLCYAIELNCARTSSESSSPSLCTLGLRKKDSRFIRDSEVEARYDATSKARVEDKLERGIWTWTTSRPFYIHTSSSGEPRQRREVKEEPAGVSDVFSKAHNWLAGHCPFRQYLFPAARSLRSNNTQGQGRKAAESGLSFNLVRRCLSMKGLRKRQRQATPTRKNGRRKGKPGRVRFAKKSKHEVLHPHHQALHQVSLDDLVMQRMTQWTREYALSADQDAVWPLRPQFRDQQNKLKSRGRRHSSSGAGGRTSFEEDKGHRPGRRQNKDKGPRRQDSGYDSTHSSSDAAGSDSDSALSV